MFILLIESDPVVRIDLCEALDACMPDAMVVSVSKLSCLSSLEAQTRLIILDTPLAEIRESRYAQVWIENQAKVILTNESSRSSDSIPEGWRTLRRPFSEQMLLDAIAALG